MKLDIKPVKWEKEKKRLIKIRTQVFIIEQNCPPHLEFDGMDPEYFHLLAFSDNAVAGCCRISPTGKIERLSILKKFRNRGIATNVMKVAINFATDFAIALNQEIISLHAQSHLIDFYASFGYEKIGTEFQEAGIPHYIMCLKIDPTQTPSPG